MSKNVRVAIAVPMSADLVEQIRSVDPRVEVEYDDAHEHLQRDVAALERTFGPGARASWKLHPPMLRAPGMDSKITLGPRFAPALRALRSMKRLRGTKLDVFGLGEVRRVERELIPEFEQVVDALIDGLSTDTLALAGSTEAEQFH